MKYTSPFLCVLGLTCAAGAARAETAAAGHNASLTFHFSALNYSMINSSDKPDGGVETKTKRGALNTSNLDLSYAEISYGDFNFYCSPFAATKVVSASYMLAADFVELGADLGLNTLAVDKPKDADNATTIGLFVKAYPKVGTMTAELGLKVDSMMHKDSNDNTRVGGVVVPQKTDDSAVKVVVTANLVVPLAKNFSYVGGVYFANTSTTAKQAHSGIEKGKTTEGEFGVNLASFRVTVD